VPPNSAELARLVGVPATMPPADQQLVSQQTAWPQNRVLRGSRCIGFLMREVPSCFYHPRDDGTHLNELSFLIYPPKPLWSRLQQPSPDERRLLAHRFVDLLEMLHRHQVVLGDISMKNLLWTVDGGPAVFALDCDGFRLAGHPPTVPQADTPDWIDPYARPGAATFDTDRYKLALVILRTLLWEPYATPAHIARDPARAERLDPPIVDLARAASAPADRPAADAWRLALSGRSFIRFTPADLEGLAPPIGRSRRPLPGPVTTHSARPVIPLPPSERR
jgi:hypothetical protein